MKGSGIRGWGFAALALLAVAGVQSPRAQEAAPFRVEPLASPAGEDTLAPNLATEGTRTVLSWLDNHDDLPALKFSERTATGWSEPRTVVSNESLMVNPADVPVVRPLPGGSIVARSQPLPLTQSTSTSSSLHSLEEREAEARLRTR